MQEIYPIIMYTIEYITGEKKRKSIAWTVHSSINNAEYNSMVMEFVHAGNFCLFFSQYSGLKFPAVFLQKIEIFAFHRLLNILCRVSADNSSPHEWEKINRK